MFLSIFKSVDLSYPPTLITAITAVAIVCISALLWYKNDIDYKAYLVISIVWGIAAVVFTFFTWQQLYAQICIGVLAVGTALCIGIIEASPANLNKKAARRYANY